MNKIIIFLIILLLIPITSATSYQQETDIDLRHPIRINGAVDSTILANITIQYPNNSLIINSAGMSYDATSQTHNYTLLNTFTKEIGEYNYCITSTGNGLNDTSCFSFDITPSGFERINTGEGISLFGSSLIMIIIAFLFFLMFMKVESLPIKIALLSGAVIFFFTDILFTAVSIQQNLAGFTNITDGFETFVFVMKILMSVSLIAFVLFILFFVVATFIHMVRRRRGLID